ncbi:MAG: hypothetical protein H6742_11245 [Alphaproteobacteria bacterium]|nr:hypothetical protein [Alphaproteobacteria bacterium]
MLFLIPALSCMPAEPPPALDAPPEVVAPVAPPPVRWVRRGRATPAGHEEAPFAQAADATARCIGSPPCVAERWVADGADAEPLVLLHVGPRLELLEGPATGPWRTHWRAWSGALPGCLGDPLGEPVGRDPAGLRTLYQEADGRWRWRLSVSGTNPCGLSGEAWLDVDADHVDAAGLACEGRAWLDGGAACARRALRRSLGATDTEAASAGEEVLGPSP